VKELAQLLNEMCSSEVIGNYALFGATAQMRYTEPVATLDADVLVAVKSEVGLDILQFCTERGYHIEGESVRVGAWPVQFIPAFNQLTHEAMEHAEIVDFEGVPFRVVRADYLGIIALSVGRAKDFARILALLESGSVSRTELARLAKKHDLSNAWKRFESRFFHE